MTQPFTLFRSTIGMKVLMALSGAIMFGFLIGHLIGNLQVFAGPEKINAYAAFLRDSPAILWGTRIALLVALGAHLMSSLQLTMRNFDARPVAYAKKQDVATTYAARTMVWSGPIILAYIVFHLAHLTAGWVSPGYEFDYTNVYDNIVRSFQVWWVVLAYAVAQLAVGLHLYHGLWSALQTIGANHPRYNAARRAGASAITAAIVLGYLSIPAAVVAGAIQPTSEKAAAQCEHHGGKAHKGHKGHDGHKAHKADHDGHHDGHGH